MRTYSVAVVGLGVISRFYLAAIHRSPRLRLAAVCDLDETRLAPWHGKVPCYSGHMELLGARRPDAVILTTPNDTHAQVCSDLLAAGCAVCVEKPLALSSGDAAGLAAAATAAGVPLLTAFHRRHNRHVRALARALDDRAPDVPIASARVRYFERIEEHAGPDSWYLRPERCGGGCVADNGPNAFDLLRLLLGEVDVTSAELGPDSARPERRAAIELLGRGGVPVRVDLDWAYRGELKDVEVTLADGTLHHADMLAGHTGFKASLWHEYAAVLAEFTALLDGGPAADRVAAGQRGVAAAQLVEAAYRAARGPLVPRAARGQFTGAGR